MRIALVEPEIPQNTGSIARLAAATNTPLDLIGPLGFSLEDRYLKRAGLDYWPFVDLSVYESWQQYLGRLRGECTADRVGEAGGASEVSVSQSEASAAEGARMIAFSARAARPYTRCRFRRDDILVFGKETKGLDPAILSTLAETTYTIPIENPGVRSLNLSNAVSIVVYEARRQLGIAR